MSAIEVTALIKKKSTFINKKKSTFRNETCARKRLYYECEGRQKTLSLAITVWHHSASLMMPDCESRDGLFYLPLTPMTDSGITRLAEWIQTVIVRDGVFYLPLTPMTDSYNPSRESLSGITSLAEWIQTVIAMYGIFYLPSHPWQILIIRPEDHCLALQGLPSESRLWSLGTESSI